MYRQGDVWIIPMTLPNSLKLKKLNKRGAVLAEGEVTGHAHVAMGKNVKLYEDNKGVLWLSCPTKTPVKHEEHATITLPKGDYKIVHQREWTDEMEPRRVAD